MNFNRKTQFAVLFFVVFTGYAVYSAFAQLPPPPPPPPPGGTTSPSPSGGGVPPPPPPPPPGGTTSPAPTPGGPAGAGPSCPSVYFQRCGFSAISGNDGSCISALSCTQNQCYDAAGLSVCETTAYSDSGCAQACSFGGSGSTGVYQCQDSAQNPQFGTCYSGGTDPLGVCIGSCSGACIQCTQVCSSGIDCDTPGTGGTNNAYQCVDGTVLAGCFGSQTECYDNCDLINVGACQECPSAACSAASNCVTGGSGGENIDANDGEVQQTDNTLPGRTPPKDYGVFQKSAGSGNLDLSILKPGNFTDFLALLSCVFKYLLYFAIPLAVIVFIVGGIMFVTSQGDPGKITTGKHILLWGVVGLTLVLLARGILAALLGFFTGGGSAALSSCSIF